MHQIKALKDKIEFLESLNQNAKIKTLDFENDPVFVKFDAKFSKFQSDNEKCLTKSEVITKNFLSIIEKVDIIEKALRLKEKENCPLQDALNQNCLLEREQLLRLKRESSFIDVACDKVEWAKTEGSFQSCNAKNLKITHPECQIRKIVVGHRMEEIEGKQIEELKAFNEQIIFLPLKFPENFPNLKTLSFIACGLISVNTKALNGLRMLQTLTFSHNAIKTISNEGFENLDSLTTVDLSHNRIENISDEALQNLLELSVLKLNDNLLCCLMTNIFARQQKLKFLFLQRNKLSSISPTLLEPLKKLEFVDVTENDCINLLVSKETTITLKNLKPYFAENCSDV